MRHDSWASLLAYNLATPCLGHEPKVRVATLKVDPKSYNCQKGFYSTLIQGIVDAKCSFWD